MSIWGRLSEATRELSLGGVGVITLSAKMAKTNGTVDTYEVRAFKEAFKVSAAEMKQAAAIFNSAKRDAANFEDHAERLVTVFGGNRKLLEDVLDGLFHIAKADEDVCREEEQFLSEVAKHFGFSAPEFESMKARHIASPRRNPHAVLGVSSSISDEELDRRYRKLIEDDDAEQLVARGVPKEFAIIAIEKRAALSDAYDAVMKERSG